MSRLQFAGPLASYDPVDVARFAFQGTESIEQGRICHGYSCEDQQPYLLVVI
jgi:hypothetical protein